MSSRSELGLSDESAQRSAPSATTFSRYACCSGIAGSFNRRLNETAKIHYAGLVICRQRPGTAGGIVFMTLEDETGFVNVVVWENIFQRYSVLAKTVNFLESAVSQVEDNIVHLVAEKLGNPK